MDEGRKRTILIAASVHVARKWDQLGGRPSPALDAAITDAVALAEKIMQRIDARTAAPPTQRMTSNAGYPWKGRTSIAQRSLNVPNFGKRFLERGEPLADPL